MNIDADDLHDLVDAATEFAEWGQVLDDLQCHRYICTTGQCVRCSKVITLRAALLKVQGELS
jgi:hypothetical protein